MERSLRRVFLITTAIVVLLDQTTKFGLTAWLAPRGSVTVIPGLFDLTYVLNRGAVFGIFASLEGPWRAVLLTAVPVIAVGCVLVMAYRTPAHQLRPLIALGLVMGGAIGNLVDRVRLGAVVDFFYWHIADYYWPAFNVADSAICVGVGLLVLHMVRT